jgi:hypothetical protein
MNTITITVPSSEFEDKQLQLTAEDVLNIYLNRKDMAVEIKALKKEVTAKEQTIKYRDESLNEAKAELQQGHALLSALSVADKTTEEEAYYRKPLSIVTRIALYLATKGN